MLSDTIAALSSGAPPAGIAVLRISGPHARDAVEALAGAVPPPRRASLRTLKSPADGTLLDAALLLWFPGPASATGEDLAELHLHGGRAVVAAVLAALLGQPGVRAATAGEFTQRALRHGRIDLAEAEGLADLLAAETEAQRRQAVLTATGALSQEVSAWQTAVLTLAARVESLLDFADEDDVAADATAVAAIRADADVLRVALDEWLARPLLEPLRDGLSVVIAGPPNAGKSTLINALTQSDAAIVTDIAGTTRDIIEVPVSLGGVAMRLTDTAGLREAADDPVESIGIARAEARARAADILLWLGSADSAPAHPQCILVAAKADLAVAAVARASAMPTPEPLRVSAHTGLGLDALQTELLGRAAMLLPVPGEAALNQRQRAALKSARDALDDVPGDPLLLAEHLRAAQRAFDELTGAAGTEAMFDALFSRFCIGK